MRSFSSPKLLLSRCRRSTKCVNALWKGVFGILLLVWKHTFGTVKSLWRKIGFVPTSFPLSLSSSLSLVLLSLFYLFSLISTLFLLKGRPSCYEMLHHFFSSFAMWWITLSLLNEALLKLQGHIVVINRSDITARVPHKKWNSIFGKKMTYSIKCISWVELRTVYSFLYEIIQKKIRD